jgi:hypothetical protein
VAVPATPAHARFTAGRHRRNRQRRRAAGDEKLMSFHTARSPFTEVRDRDRQVTLFVVATSAVATCGTFVAGVLFVLGLS